MKQRAKYLVGSQAFFAGMPDFRPKDTDWLYTMDGWDMSDATTLALREGDGTDRIFIPADSDADTLIADTLKSGEPLRAGKFLVPDFACAVGLTVAQLQRLAPLFDKIDAKHRYQRVIFAAYIENGKLELTDDQRLQAFESYKAARQQ